MTRPALVAALLFALAPPACGGRTGLNVRVDVANEMRPGVDFNRLELTVTSATGTFGESVHISAATPKPYRAIVWAVDGTTFKATVHAQLWKDAQQLPNGDQIKEFVFTEGELAEVVIAFE